MSNYAIYKPKGKAAEYSEWACNFYVGCSNGCTYCYCKKGILAGVMGQDKPQLKKCFKDETHALKVFEKELLANLDELRKHGLFFSFTTDPMLKDAIALTVSAIDLCQKYNVPVKILTKCTQWVRFVSVHLDITRKNLMSFVFTLTGHDELVPNASSNKDRIRAMKVLSDAGFKTWASIEPIIDFEDSYEMIYAVKDFCDLYKIGLQSGRKYDEFEPFDFVIDMIQFNAEFCKKIYFKDSLLKAAGINRADLPSNCVDRSYNIFKS